MIASIALDRQWDWVIANIALDRQWNWVIASIALAVVLMTAWLTGSSDYLTNILEPLLAPHGCHTGFRNV